jgi:23S rRNA (cytidine1920-2'-O)/16S rRNA (cytidine1409-2'-O)-methyltransferase
VRPALPSVPSPQGAANVARTIVRGEAKLRQALRAMVVTVSGRIALDVGAAAGGFTRVLRAAGAVRVYAVDAGHGQLLGSLRQDQRVVMLERTNLGELGPDLVPDLVEVVTMDLSYLPVARAAPQLEAVRLAPRADLVALVKPQHELGLGAPPDDHGVAGAIETPPAASRRAVGTSWAATRSPVLGARGAVEWLVHARR